MTTNLNEYLETKQAPESEFGPSDALTSVFRACPTDPTKAIDIKLNHLLTRFMLYCKTTASVPAQQCFQSKIKMWYYKLLEVLLEQRCLRSRFKDLSSFLEDDQLQCAVVVCCLEISLCTNNRGFDPQLLQFFHLAPYNLWEIINLVLQANHLTLDVTKHLKKIEEIIVESLAWTRDSPIWEEIGANEGQMPACQQVMSPKELEEPMRGHEAQQADQSSSQQEPILKRPQRSSRLYMFAHKMYRLMAERLRRLCSSLNLKDEQRMKIWACFEFSLVHHFDIMRDSHLDWLLLCAIHTITKDTKDLRPFKLIIDCLNSQRSKHENVRSNPETTPAEDSKALKMFEPSGRLPTPITPSTHDQEKDPIATFYSQVYITAMQHFVKKSALTPGGKTPLSPYPRQPSPSNRKYRMRSGCNVFLSQLKKAPGSPQLPGMDYTFQSSPSQRLRDINDMVKSGRTLSKRSALLLDETDGDNGPTAKTSCVSSLSLLRRLEEVAHDRNQCRKEDFCPEQQ